MRRLALGLSLLFGPVSIAAAMDVTACGQSVPPRAVGVLQADLICPPLPAVAVTVGANATLDLGGHALEGSSVIECQGGGCTVTSTAGTGHVDGSVRMFAKGRLAISNVAIVATPTDLAGIDVVNGSVDAAHVQVSGSSYYGIITQTLIATDVGSSNNPGTGVFTTRRLKAQGLTTSGNGKYGAAASASARLRQFVAIGNGLEGLGGRSLAVDTATITGNAGGTSDVVSTTTPRFTNVTCDHSLKTGSTPPESLHVCAGD